MISTTPNVRAGVYYSQQEKEYYGIIKHDNLCFTIQIMAVRKKKETEMDNFLAPCLHEEGHPASEVNLSKLLNKKKSWAPWYKPTMLKNALIEVI